MKRVLKVLLVLGVVLGGYLGVAHLSGGAFWALGLALGGDRGDLRRTALAFLEDIQFKDFISAASYHAPDVRSSVDIPFLIQRLFAVKPEALDIMDYDIVFAELDSSGLRARVKSRVKVRFLLDGRIEERDLILYFDRDSVADPWYMKLEDSLRDLQPDSTKEH
ncbi:MAG TPA: hypothetical protein VGA70_02225 [Longimicrobiales bacterium]|jgi:hypothetical protein